MKLLSKINKIVSISVACWLLSRISYPQEVKSIASDGSWHTMLVKMSSSG